MLIARPATLLDARANTPPRRDARTRGRALELVALAAIVLIALALRTYALDTVPLGLHGDEAVSGLEAERILRDGNIGPYTGEALGQPTGPLYLIALAVHFLGNTIVAVRLVPALLGTTTILALFVVARRSFGPTVALCGTAPPPRLTRPTLSARAKLARNAAPRRRT